MDLEPHRQFLWALCYRMTGSTADADDLVQDTFSRALERPPADLRAPMRPWLTQVAVNLARDAVRRRKRAPYPGPWLPSPVDTENEAAAVEPALTQGRYDLLESVSFAFLLALEALTPKQRAVLLLRDVFDYSVAEVAVAVGISEANAKQIHLRARRALDGYDQRRVRPTPQMQERNRTALNGFLEAMLSNDVGQVEALLAADAEGWSDGGGRYHAATQIVRGRHRVARFLMGVHHKRGPAEDFELKMLNGLPALVLRYPAAQDRRLAPLVVIRLDLAPDGSIAAVHSLLAPQKLADFPRVAL